MSNAQGGEAFFGFEQREVYQRALGLVVKVYGLVENLPSDERFGLTGQLERAVNLVAFNIAEGKGRGSDRDFVRFLYQSRGSLLETVCGLQIGLRWKFFTREKVKPTLEICRELNSRLNALIACLEPAGPRPRTLDLRRGEAHAHPL